MAKNTIKGSVWGILYRFVCTVLPFIIRTIVIREFGEQYLGLNSLFTSILQVLNLSELGITNAIVFSMYKPIAEDDTAKLSALLAFYKKLYFFIGVFILIAGLGCLPFLPKLISGSYPPDINIYILYLVFLSNTCISYFFWGYKEAVLTAYQNLDIISIVRVVTFFSQFVVQIMILLELKNYYLYISVMVVFTLLRGFINSKIVSRRYPEIKPEGRIESKELKAIKVNMFGVTLGKLCTVSRGTFDEIIMSSFLGLSALAIFDNYYYIISAIVATMNVIEHSMISGVGNSIVLDGEDKNYCSFKRINFIYMWVAGIATVCLLCLYQPFMLLWVGKSLMVKDSTMVLFAMYFYTGCYCSITNVYSTASGQWWNLRYKSIFEVIINLALNIILIRLLGMSGIIIATIISYTVVSFIWGSLVLFKNYFKSKSIYRLILTMAGHTAITLIIGFACYGLCSLIHADNLVINCFIRLIVCLVLANALYALFFFRSVYFSDLKSVVSRVLKQFHLIRS